MLRNSATPGPLTPTDTKVRYTGDDDTPLKTEGLGPAGGADCST